MAQAPRRKASVLGRQRLLQIDGYPISVFRARFCFAKCRMGGHTGPSPSSDCAAPSLRSGRFAMTAPVRCGQGSSMSLLRKDGLLAGLRSKDHGKPLA